MANDTVKIEDVESVCRICLQNSSDRIDVFSSIEGYPMIASAIMECAPIQIMYGDNLPSTICQNCIVQLDIAFRFRMLCVQSDVTLRQTLSKTNNEEDKIKEEILDVNDHDSVSSFPANVEDIKDEISSDDDKILSHYLDSNRNDSNGSIIDYVKQKNEYKCSRCMTLFKRKYHLQRHQKKCLIGKIKLKKKRFSVKTESTEFPVKEVTTLKLKLKPYTTFKENIEQDENGRFSCRICHKTYKSKYHTARHAIVHSDLRFNCPHCEKSFVRPASLREHINVHTGKRSYNCEFCGKIFRTDSALNTHRRIHLGVRPYKCEVCERTFTQNKTLKNHMRTHTGERPFVCETCGRSFNRKHILKTHTMIHTGERPHRCEICERTFICKQHLQLHMVKHTGEPASSFRCSICDKRFNTNQLKVKHELEIHNISVQM